MFTDDFTPGETALTIEPVKKMWRSLMRTRFITISIVLITICAVSHRSVGLTQTGRIPGVVRPEKSAAKDSGPSADDGPKSRMRLADYSLQMRTEPGLLKNLPGSLFRTRCNGWGLMRYFTAA